ncbi:hypothetical protein PAGA_b0154 [Pseudoalteromonas agarivorans DSM 14585]|uniref:Uncharacterized protein n=1 Tax=Pseudoalteromonas agarivorans DSM 14585 TaxID=1312369 RepID=A0ACA8E0T0_9GAMM|nr:hypothetical protein PAGA_b0154 [Pseudoalteromonas agarivorans DSM 14585]
MWYWALLIPLLGFCELATLMLHSYLFNLQEQADKLKNL